MTKTALIYLAAGNSRRFGRNKLLYEIKGRPMYLHLLERLMEITDRDDQYELLVVTRYREIRETVEAFRQKGHRISCVWSPESETGISCSIKAALLRVKDACACAFFVADQPWLTKESAAGFLEHMKDAGLGCVRNDGRTGNPVWFARKYFSELMELKGDEGGKKVFLRHRREAVYYEIKNRKELEDIDWLSYNRKQMIKEEQEEDE